MKFECMVLPAVQHAMITCGTKWLSNHVPVSVMMIVIVKLMPKDLMPDIKKQDEHKLLILAQSHFRKLYMHTHSFCH